MITNKGTLTIQTQRLKLRKFTVDDAQAMYDNWAKDGRVPRFLTWQPHESPEATRRLLEIWCAEYEDPGRYQWAIEYQETVIGSITVVRLDEWSEWAEIGYCIGYDFWNKGIMSEAAKAVIGFLFAEVGVNRISICHAVKNPASGRVAQKCGLTLEGTRREFYKDAAGEFLDISEYSILRREWQ